MTECDMEDAIQKAEEFLAGYHSTINLKSSNLEDGIWHLVFDVGFLSEQIKEIQIDAITGKITGYTSMDIDDEDGD